MSTPTGTQFKLIGSETEMWTKDNITTVLGDYVLSTTFNTATGNIDTALGLKANAADVYDKDHTYNKDEIDGMVSSVYRVKGSVQSYENLPPATANKVGDVWNVIDTNLNYVWVTSGDPGEEEGYWDPLGMDIDLSKYCEVTAYSGVKNAVETSGSSWNNTHDAMTASSSNWNSVYASVSTNSGNWGNAYTTLTANSGAWGAAAAKVTASSGNWDGAYTTVNASATKWSTAYTTLTANSGHWDTAYDAIDTSATYWNNTYTSVSTNSGNWDTAYTTITTNSGHWDTAYDAIDTSATKWNNTYTSVSTNSGNWDDAYDAIDTSATKWNSVYTSVSTNSGNWGTAYTTLTANSGAWGAAAAKVTASSGNWDGTYNTVLNSSGTWGGGGDARDALASIYNNVGKYATADATAEGVPGSAAAWAEGFKQFPTSNYNIDDLVKHYNRTLAAMTQMMTIIKNELDLS